MGTVFPRVGGGMVLPLSAGFPWGSALLVQCLYGPVLLLGLITSLQQTPASQRSPDCSLAGA